METVRSRTCHLCSCSSHLISVSVISSLSVSVSHPSLLPSLQKKKEGRKVEVHVVVETDSGTAGEHVLVTWVCTSILPSTFSMPFPSLLFDLDMGTYPLHCLPENSEEKGKDMGRGHRDREWIVRDLFWGRMLLNFLFPDRTDLMTLVWKRRRTASEDNCTCTMLGGTGRTWAGSLRIYGGLLSMHYGHSQYS